jgi:acyl CoA:acetate/3-ketoacid CoA transferase alpha subunit
MSSRWRCRGDRHEKRVCNKSTRNFGPLPTTASRISRAEGEEPVEPGDTEPDP